MRRRVLSGLSAALAWSALAGAQSPAATSSATDAADTAGASEADAASAYRTPLRTSSGYLQLFAPFALGRGIRFNNPYRLQTSLGKTAESLSLTASYLDFGLGALWGPQHGVAHGGVAHLSWAVQGIPQQVLSVSYIALARFAHFERVLPFARAGVPIIIQPDVNAGLEGALGAAYLLRAGLGLQGELVGSLYYGASTIERKVTTIPVLSVELGVWVDYEVLP